MTPLYRSCGDGVARGLSMLWFTLRWGSSRRRACWFWAGPSDRLRLFHPSFLSLDRCSRSRSASVLLPAVVLIFAAYSCQQPAPPPRPPLPPLLNSSDLVGRWKHEHLGVWEFTIEPSGAQRFQMESFGTTVLSAHWRIDGRHLRFENVTGIQTGFALLDLLFRDEASVEEARKGLNELEIRSLSCTTLTLGHVGNNNPKEQITFQRE